MTIDLTNKKAMESYFADYFDTVLFPVLAEMYLREGDIKRAKKVCEIGLNYHPNHTEALFILASVEIANENLVKAEKLLKSIVLTPQPHYQGAIMLANIQMELGRSPNTIGASWKRVLKINPAHPGAVHFFRPEIKTELKRKVDHSNEIQFSSRRRKSVRIRPRNFQESEMEPLIISPRLATFTLVAVLKNQGLLHQALEVLDTLEQKGEDAVHIEHERKTIQNSIESGDIQ
jgi:tetratricopeptide (TPR) repeat protein